MFPRATVLIAVAWIGALWTICGIVAPTLFTILDDRHLAGQIAGTFFGMVAWAGVVSGILLLATRVLGGRVRDPWLVVWTAVAALLPLASILLLTPVMDAARASGDMARFGTLHGVSAVLFGGACLAGIGVVLRLTRPAA
jgi:hypothetical protein